MPQEYVQPNNKESSNHNSTPFNHLKRGIDDPYENFLDLFWTFEGVNFSQDSKKGHNEEDQKALKTLAETTHHNGETYEIGLPWRENVTLPNNYFMARVHALLTGPDFLCNLHGLLLRFRQYEVAVTADIEVMFTQVGISDEDQNAPRFLWSDNDEEKTSKYQQLVFGATFSPACAIFVLQKCANDNRREHPKIID